MSNTVYNVKSYVRFSLDEFIALLVTSFFAGFILTFNDWGDTAFDAGTGIQALLLMSMFLLFILIVTVWICKVIAIRVGYIVHYRAHLIGMMIGLFLTVLSRGYLPIFLPGGFVFEQPERLTVGKWRALRKTWETGLVAGTFPLVLLLWVLVFNPLYLATQSTFYLSIITATCLMAVYSCIPLPFIESSTKGRLLDWFKYLRGSTFGLDVFYASGNWFVVLCCTVLFFSLLAYILTVASVGVGIFIYILSLAVALVALWVYRQFFKHQLP